MFADQLVAAEANEIVAEKVREKIRAVVKDPDDRRARCAPGTMRSAPSGPASTPTTTRRSTCRTSG